MQTITNILNRSKNRQSWRHANPQLQLVISTYLFQQLTGQWRGKKAFKDIGHLNSTNQRDLIGIYRTLKPAEYTLFSSEQGTSNKTDHMLGHETSFN